MKEIEREKVTWEFQWVVEAFETIKGEKRRVEIDRVFTPYVKV